MSNPFTGAQLYVDPNSLAQQWCSQNPTNAFAAIIQPIANTPQAFWLGKWSGNVQQFVQAPEASLWSSWSMESRRGVEIFRPTSSSSMPSRQVRAEELSS